jgi:hypothetical protein
MVVFAVAANRVPTIAQNAEETGNYSRDSVKSVPMKIPRTLAVLSLLLFADWQQEIAAADHPLIRLLTVPKVKKAGTTR